MGTAAYTPAATCCGAGGVFQCAPIAAAWEFDPWAALAFSSANEHSFVFAYDSAAGDAAVVSARGDLDCDGTSIDYTLSCSATSGNPACTLLMPAVCDAEYPD